MNPRAGLGLGPWPLAFPLEELENGAEALLQIPKVELCRVGMGTWCSWKKDGLGCCRGRAGVSGWTSQETLSFLESLPYPWMNRRDKEDLPRGERLGGSRIH